MNPDYENLNLGKVGYSKYFGEDCVEWFVTEMLKKEGYMKKYFEKEIGVNLDTILKNYDRTTCWLCEKDFKPEDKNENPVVKDHFLLTGKFRGLADNICNLNTQEAHFSFVALFSFQDFRL